MRKNHKILELLKKDFPKAFFDSAHVKPLVADACEKLLDYYDLHPDEGLNEKQIFYFMRWYKERPAYLNAIVRESYWVDLQGNPVADITPDDKELAIDKRVEIYTARKERDVKKKENKV